jgi:branched-chain amino acid transport system ATP-binding protein
MLEVRELTRSFGAVRALNGVDLDVQDGELMGIIGPNGCGKTTLFNCISGRLRPSSGHIKWRGDDITGWPMERVARTGLVRTFQESMIFPSGTARENVEMANLIARSHRSKDPQDRIEALPTGTDELLEFSGLGSVAETPTASMPFGSIRQLGIAMALAVQPRLLMLDEPAAGLNAAEGEQFAEFLTRVHAVGVTLCVVDHDMDFLLPLVERVVVLAAGEKLLEGTAEEVTSDAAVVEVYLGSAAPKIEQSADASDPGAPLHG